MLRSIHQLIISVALALTLVGYLVSAARATPGPESTLLVINRLSDESVVIGEHYARARHLVPSFRCVIEAETTELIDQVTFERQMLLPILDCLARHPTRIEAMVLTRGTPLRVAINQVNDSIDGPTLTLSSASLLVVAQSIDQRVSLASPERSHRYAELISCAQFGPCWSPLLENPWRDGHFSPRWFTLSQGVQWAPIWVTRLDAYSVSDVLRMIDRSVESDRSFADPLPSGEVLMMRGANPPRAILDGELSELSAELEAGGVQSAQVDFDPDYLHPQPILALVTGSAQLGQVIEGNQFVAGSLVDNLTSFGAHPANFNLEADEVQVSVARWVAMGVTGVHGATAEPLNYSFPSRATLLDYTRGATLSEAFWRHIPYLAWQNLVLGDPMSAPFMERPTLHLERDERGASLLKAEVAPAQRVREISLWVEGEMIAQSVTSPLHVCLGVEVEALMVVQSEPLSPEDSTVSTGLGSGLARGYAKGWARFRIPACSLERDAGGELDLAFDEDALFSEPTDAELIAEDDGSRDGSPARSDQDVAQSVDAELDSATSTPLEMSVSDSDQSGCQSASRGAKGGLALLLMMLFVRVRRMG